MERLKRQKRIDEGYVEDIWAKRVDNLLVEMCLSRTLPSNPAVLLPELRMASLFRTVVESFPKHTKLMIVDQSNTRFDYLRQSVPGRMSNAYFSTQLLNALNYSENVFDVVLTQASLGTLHQYAIVLPEYHRVLKPGGGLVFCTPLEGTLNPFLDLLREALIKLDVREREGLLSQIQQSMQLPHVQKALTNYGFRIITQGEVSFSLHFPSIEDFLFSTLIESYYLASCIHLLQGQEGKVLLTQVVKSFHHYFQGLSMTADLRLECFLCEKSTPP